MESVNASRKKRAHIDLVSDAPTSSSVINLHSVALLPDAADNCAIARRVLHSGTLLYVESHHGRHVLSLQCDVFVGHRFVITPVAAGASLTSWGLPFAEALLALKPGDGVFNGLSLQALQSRAASDSEELCLPNKPTVRDLLHPFTLETSAFQSLEELLSVAPPTISRASEKASTSQEGEFRSLPCAPVCLLQDIVFQEAQQPGSTSQFAVAPPNSSRNSTPPHRSVFGRSCASTATTQHPLSCGRQFPVRTFFGYPRGGGRGVGTRSCVGVVTLGSATSRFVGSISRTADSLVGNILSAAVRDAPCTTSSTLCGCKGPLLPPVAPSERGGGDPRPPMTGHILPVTHTEGSGGSRTGRNDHLVLRTIAGFVTHVNVGAAFVVSSRLDGSSVDLHSLAALLSRSPAVLGASEVYFVELGGSATGDTDDRLCSVYSVGGLSSLCLLTRDETSTTTLSPAFLNALLQCASGAFSLNADGSIGQSVSEFLSCISTRQQLVALIALIGLLQYHPRRPSSLAPFGLTPTADVPLKDCCTCGRRPMSGHHLRVALQCGGSDSFSGATGNPLSGYAAGELIRTVGGSAVLAESPELIGAEPWVVGYPGATTTRAVADEFLETLTEYQRYAHAHGQSAEGNPSGGNLYRGLINITLKSIGAAQKKPRNVPLGGVVPYGGRIACACAECRDLLQACAQWNKIVQLESSHPFDGAAIEIPHEVEIAYGKSGYTDEGGTYFFMDSPGNDLESIAGQVATGCNLIFFITGNASITNFPFVPTVKIVSTSQRYNELSGDMDIDAESIWTADAEATPLFNAAEDSAWLASASQDRLRQPRATSVATRADFIDYFYDVCGGRPTYGERAGHSQTSIWRDWAFDYDVDDLRSKPQDSGVHYALLLEPSNTWQVKSLSKAIASSLPFVRLLVPTSLCSSAVSLDIARQANSQLAAWSAEGPQPKDIAWVVALAHTEGCGQGGDAAWQRLFVAAHIGHMLSPYVRSDLRGGLFMLEHGCEKTHLDFWGDTLAKLRIPVRFHDGSDQFHTSPQPSTGVTEEPSAVPQPLMHIATSSIQRGGGLREATRTVLKVFGFPLLSAGEDDEDAVADEYAAAASLPSGQLPAKKLVAHHTFCDGIIASNAEAKRRIFVPGPLRNTDRSIPIVVGFDVSSYKVLSRSVASIVMRIAARLAEVAGFSAVVPQLISDTAVPPGSAGSTSVNLAYGGAPPAVAALNVMACPLTGGPEVLTGLVAARSIFVLTIIPSAMELRDVVDDPCLRPSSEGSDEASEESVRFVRSATLEAICPASALVPRVWVVASGAETPRWCDDVVSAVETTVLPALPQLARQNHAAHCNADGLFQLPRGYSCISL